MSEQTFTKAQVDDWKAFEKVRKCGKWNMCDPRARQATGLNEERYRFVMDNFSELTALASAEVEVL